MISKQQIKHIRSLQQKKYRDESKKFIVEGIKIVNEAIAQAPSFIRTIVSTEQMAEKLKINSDINSSVEIISASPADFNRISSQKNPQQILAVLDQGFSDKLNISDNQDLIIALDRIQDPGNLGTIIRLADWFGINEILCSSDTADCFNPKVIQASMGAILRVRVNYGNLPKQLAKLKTQAGYTVYGTPLNGRNIYETQLKKPAIVILGNEASGVSDIILEQTDENIFIPNYSAEQNKSESLNVSTAAAIICSEFSRP